MLYFFPLTDFTDRVYNIILYHFMLLIAINGTGHVYTTVINNIIKRLQTVSSGVHHGFMGEWGDVGLLPPTTSNIGVSIISLHGAGDYHKKNGRRMKLECY